MPLTPQDLQQIAGLVKAGQCGFLPPYLLGSQLTYQQTRLDNLNPGDQVAQGNANRVWLAFICGNTCLVVPEGYDLTLNTGWLAPTNYGDPWPVFTTRDGVLPQLRWVLQSPAVSSIVVLEQIWSPASGLGIT